MIFLLILFTGNSFFTKLNAQYNTDSCFKVGIDIGPRSCIDIYINVNGKELIRDDARDLGKFLLDVGYFKDDGKYRKVVMSKVKDVLILQFVLAKRKIAKKGKEVQKINLLVTIR